MPEVAPNLMPRIENGSIGLMPSGPPVRFTFWTDRRVTPAIVRSNVMAARFLKKTGTISPKPSVTMAR